MPAELPRNSGELDINIEDDVDFSLVATYKIATVAVDVTSYTATFTLRDERGQSGTPLLQLTEGAGIVVGTTDGKFTVSITDTQAVFGDREMTYDLVVKSPTGVDTRLLRGKCKSWAGAK